MAKRTKLPIDPRTGLLDIGTMLAFNRALYGDARMDDSGGAGSDGGGAGSGSGGDGGGTGGAGGQGGAGGGDGAQGGDLGFPANTPTEQMTVEQREAYWKHQARKHEDRWKAYGGVSPEKVKELRDKAAQHDALERELMSDKDKAVTEAKETAERDTAAKFVPRLVRAEFRAALKGRVADEHLDERVATITDPLDLSKFLNDAGDVDTDKVTKFVDGIAPATGNSGPGRRGPTATGHGSGAGGNGRGSSSSGALTGRELYELRHNKKTTANA